MLANLIPFSISQRVWRVGVQGENRCIRGGSESGAGAGAWPYVVSFATLLNWSADEPCRRNDIADLSITDLEIRLQVYIFCANVVVFRVS